MGELASLHLCVWRFNLAVSVNWGGDDGEEQQPALMARPDLIEVPEIDDDGDDLSLGFR